MSVLCYYMCFEITQIIFEKPIKKQKLQIVKVHYAKNEAGAEKFQTQNISQ